MTLAEPRAEAPRTTNIRTPDIDIASTRPGTPGGKFMRQFWIALDNSSNLPAGRAKPIRIMSENYTLYRGHSGHAQGPGSRLEHQHLLRQHLGQLPRRDAEAIDRDG